MSSINSTPLVESIRRTIEERNLLTARTRVKYVSALRSAGAGGRSTLQEIPTVESRILKLRSKVVQELLSSEKSYIKQISTVVLEFKYTLEMSGVLERKFMDVLFGNIELIKTLNEELLKELKTTNVTSAFSKFAPMLKIYSAYAGNYQQSIETLQAIMSDISPTSGAADVIKQKEQLLGCKLSALLITPIQRIPRYKLLLGQLFSFTTGEPDATLKRSLDIIDDVASHMNDMVRRIENSQQLLELQSYFKKSLRLELIQPGTELVKHGIVYKLPKHTRRYLILLKDKLYICKMQTGVKIRLHCPIVVPLKRSIVNLIGDNVMVHCTGETPVRFTTLVEGENVTDWYNILAETIKFAKKRATTLKKDSSCARPTLFKSRTSARLQSSNSTDTPQPGKLKRYLNISSRLDEVVNFLSPKKPRI